MNNEEHSKLPWLGRAWQRAVELSIAFVLGMALAWAITLTASQPRGFPIHLNPPPTPAPILVHVTGAVMHPGVYALPPDARVRDAIAAAGGTRPEALTDAINLAAKLEDGQQIVVPSVSPLSSTPTETLTMLSTPTASAPYPLDINRATAEELEALPGIGPTLAQRILTYRAEHGPFHKVEDLLAVPGIGPATLERLRPYLTVDTP